MDLYPRIGRYLRDHAKPTDTIALQEIGMIGYYSGIRILDLDLLATPSLAREQQQGRYSAWLFERKPEFLWLYTPQVDANGDPYGDLTVRSQAEFWDGYRFEQRFLARDGPGIPQQGTGIDLYRRVPDAVYAARVEARRRDRFAAVAALNGRPLPKWRFAAAADMNSWSCTELAVTAPAVRDGASEVLRLQSQGPAPTLETALSAPIPVAAVDSLVLRMAVSRDPRAARQFGQLYAATSASPQFTRIGSPVFQLIPDGNFHTYRLRVSRLHVFTGDGKLLRLRLDPGHSPGDLAITSLEALPPGADADADVEFP